MDSKKTVNIRLPEDLVNLIQRVIDSGVGPATKTELVRRALEEHLPAAEEDLPDRPRGNKRQVIQTSLDMATYDRIHKISKDRSRQGRSSSSINAILEVAIARCLSSRSRRWGLNSEDIATTEYATDGTGSRFEIPEGTVVRGNNGTYRVTTLLDSSGQADVYHGVNPKKDERVCIKVPRVAAAFGGDREWRRESLAQAREACQAEHKAHQAVVALEDPMEPSEQHFALACDIGELEGYDLPCLVFPRVNGVDLKTWLTQHKTWPLEDVDCFLALARQMAQALTHLHRAGYTHGDLHPGNVMVRNRDGKPHVVLVDLGLSSRLADPFNTRPIAIKPGFRPPEGRVNQDGDLNEPTGTCRPDERFDIWQYGALLFHMLTCDSAESLTALDDALPLIVGDSDYHKYSVQLRLTEKGSRIIEERRMIVDLISRCLRPRPQDRPQSAEAVLRDIDLCDGGELRHQKPDYKPVLAEMGTTLQELDRSGDDDVFYEIGYRHFLETAATLQRLRTESWRLTGDHETLVYHMCCFLSLLEAGDSYYTVSFAEFWDKANIGTQGRYLTLNLQAALKGVCVRRVLVASQERFAGSDASGFTRQVLRAHQRNVTECAISLRSTNVTDPNPSARGYYTAVTFIPTTKEYESLLARGENFALWLRKNKAAGIFPEYVDGRMVAIRFIRLTEPAKDELMRRYESYLERSSSIVRLPIL